ncbi:MAG: nucleotidyltransferase family protein [bacterium]|nr:MAG: nucleotidyltransferase family protein [bacterium]
MGIFGSFVRGEQKENSDVDVIVEFYEIPSLLKFIEIENYLTKILGVKVDLVRRKALRAELKDTIMQEIIFI